MAAKYGDNAIGSINDAARRAAILVRHAENVQTFFREKFGQENRAHDAIRYAGSVEGAPHSFRLSTPFGEVRADFDLRQTRNGLAGRYLFSRVRQLPTGDIEAKGCYAFVFTRQGVASFNESLDEDWTFGLEDWAAHQHAHSIAIQLLGNLAEMVPEV